MKHSAASIVAAVISTLVAGGALAYQVTGPVLEVTDSKIVVEKGKEKWEIKRNKDTKASGGTPKKGDRVTVEYDMHATSIELRDAKGGKAAAKDAKKEDKKK
jgi:hypothetical protein